MKLRVFSVELRNFGGWKGVVFVLNWGVTKVALGWDFWGSEMGILQKQIFSPMSISIRYYEMFSNISWKIRHKNALNVSYFAISRKHMVRNSIMRITSCWHKTVKFCHKFEIGKNSSSSFSLFLLHLSFWIFP